MSELQLTILGSSSAIPVSNKFPTSQFLTIADRHFLIDCGEGTQVRLRQNNIGFGRVNHIMISHLHGDHFYGLVPLLSSLHLLDREDDMHIYAPEGAQEAVESLLKNTGGRLRFSLVFHDLNENAKAKIYDDDAVEVYSFPVEHGMPCFGFYFQEKERPRNMRKDKLQEYSIPVAEIRQIKRGADWKDEEGNIIPNEELTLPPVPPLAYGFCTDTLPLDLSKYFYGVDLLYHEATFKEEHLERAKKTRHSTASQAAKVAINCKARYLLLGHFSARYRELDELLEEARVVFPKAYLAEEDHYFKLQSTRDGAKLELREGNGQ